MIKLKLFIDVCPNQFLIFLKNIFHKKICKIKRSMTQILKM
jgi:beta-galactosidase beta subunit